MPLNYFLNIFSRTEKSTEEPLQALHSEAYQNETTERPLQISQNNENIAAQLSTESAPNPSEVVLNSQNDQNYVTDGDTKDPQTPTAYYGDESSAPQNVSETQENAQYYGGDQSYQDQPYYYDQNNYQNQVSSNLHNKLHSQIAGANS